MKKIEKLSIEEIASSPEFAPRPEETVHLSNLGRSMEPLGIGEMVPREYIKTMSDYIEGNGVGAFNHAVWHGAFGALAFAYIHPHNDMKDTPRFKDIQQAFLNAYV